jgi:mannose-1-phosphate guanylyltransferase
LVYRKRADYLPKQYLNFIGKRSMLEHTLERAEKLIPAPNILTVIAREHLKFAEVRRQIAARPQECIIVQPENKDTGPGILLPLMHLHKRNPAAVVTIFPSDHFILEERVFMQHVEQAFRAWSYWAWSRTSRIRNTATSSTTEGAKIKIPTAAEPLRCSSKNPRRMSPRR